MPFHARLSSAGRNLIAEFVFFRKQMLRAVSVLAEAAPAARLARIVAALIARRKTGVLPDALWSAVDAVSDRVHSGPNSSSFRYCASVQPPAPGGRKASAAGILATTVR